MARKKKIKPKQETEPLRLYLVYDETRSGGGICAGQENDPWPNREDEYIEVHFKALYRQPPSDRFFYDSFEVTEEVYNAEKVHMAVVRYGDGDTFGRSNGHWSVEGIFLTLAEAEETLAKLEEDAGKPFTVGKYNKNWHGYFASFEGTQVEIMTVFDK